MKILLNLCCGASLAFVMALAANGLGLSSFDRTENPKDPRVKRVAYTMEVEPFGSHVRTKVVQYFETYQTEPMGLPERCASRIKQGAVPPEWTGGGMSRGMVIHESERGSLVEIPAELLRVLPAADEAVAYYLAGSHLVAVDENYKVLDLIPIPTVRLGERDSAAGKIELVRHVRHPGENR
ncbi:MAG: hypothetical protein EOP88_08415 [Verrucomicrobiaceae bacterium]|nr:MAG: hypothetical protein EOP88_08415 [Verrucomicrobiaceae bacterium]